MKKMYILILSITIMSISASFCTPNISYKQTIIPLDNDKGVPFFYDQDAGAYCVDGFDVDYNGNFYFLGGGNTTLACFSGAKQKFRKRYTEFHASQIHLIKEKLYLFDHVYNKNNIFVLDASNGLIINRYQDIIKNKVNSLVFKDTSLILEVFNNQKKIDMTTQMGYALFTLTGKFMKQVPNRYDLPEVLYPKDIEKNATIFIGEWNNNFIYWDYGDNGEQIFSLRNKEGKLIATSRINEKLLGKSFYLGFPEHRKLRNGNIYILGYIAKNAIITEISLKYLFKI